MKKRRKTTGRRQGMQGLTLCISTTMVLVLLGLMVLSMLTARGLSHWVKENLTVTAMLTDTITVEDAQRLGTILSNRPYAKSVDYISKEQALKEQTEMMGTDPTEFLEDNPFVPTLELHLNADYANRDSLHWIGKELKRNVWVTDVAYQENLMDDVNRNLNKFNLMLLVLAVLMTFISFSLISNTVRLSVYSRRFSIHTMKLVGASWGFIRRPFIWRFIGIGLLAALLACCVLSGIVYAANKYEQNLLTIITWREMTITGIAVFLFGILITALCAYISVNRFLKMTAGELYKI